MERPLLQLVTSHPATSKKLFPRRAPRWAEDFTKLTDAQLKSAHSFAKYGHENLRGVTGTTTYEGREISEAAAKVAREYPTGQGIFDGDSPQERAEKRRIDAEDTIDKMSDELERRGLRPATGGSARTDGGQPRTDGGQSQEN